MIDSFAHELKEAGLKAQDITDQTANFLAELQSAGRKVFDHWADMIGETAPRAASSK
jgi:hypothetical protein